MQMRSVAANERSGWGHSSGAVIGQKRTFTSPGLYGLGYLPNL